MVTQGVWEGVIGEAPAFFFFVETLSLLPLSSLKPFFIFYRHFLVVCPLSTSSDVPTLRWDPGSMAVTVHKMSQELLMCQLPKALTLDNDYSKFLMGCLLLNVSWGDGKELLFLPDRAC